MLQAVGHVSHPPSNSNDTTTTDLIIVCFRDVLEYKVYKDNRNKQIVEHKDTQNTHQYNCDTLTFCVPETRSEKAKRKLFRNVTMGAYDGVDGPR